jgi:hypothetical protein
VPPSRKRFTAYVAAAQNLGPSGAAVLAGNSGAATIDVGGNVVYHGPHLGLEITW